MLLWKVFFRILDNIRDGSFVFFLREFFSCVFVDKGIILIKYIKFRFGDVFKFCVLLRLGVYM